MSTANKQPAIKLSVADATGSIGHFGLWVRRGTTAAAGRAALAQLRALLPTDCTPIESELRYEVEELDPADGAGDVTRCAVLLFRTTAPGQLGLVSIPGVRFDLVDADNPSAIDLAAPAIAALIAELTNCTYCNPFGYSLTECAAGLVELRET